MEPNTLCVGQTVLMLGHKYGPTVSIVYLVKEVSTNYCSPQCVKVLHKPNNWIASKGQTMQFTKSFIHNLVLLNTKLAKLLYES